MADGWTVPGFIQVRELSTGASGRLVLALDDLTGTQVAIKYLNESLSRDPGFRDRFRGDARILGRVEDPNVVQFYEYVEGGENAAIIMELVDGVGLRRILATQGPAGPLAALAVFSGTLLALGAAHAKGVVHRDVSPDNILVDRSGAARMHDFGLSFRGAPAYLAPSSQPGPSADLYAATAVFFECLTGRPPYPAQNAVQAHRDAPIPAEAVPVPLQNLVVRGLAKDPAHRPASAADFLGELEEAAVIAYGPSWESQGRARLRELAARAEATPAPAPLPPPSTNGPAWQSTGAPRRRRAAFGGVAVVAAVAAVAAVTGMVLSGMGGRSAHGHNTAATSSPAPTTAAPVTPSVVGADMADLVAKAASGKHTAAFTYRRVACCKDSTYANGTFRLAAKSAGAYDMTVWNPAADKDFNKRTRTILIGGTAYVPDVKGWHPVPAARTPGGTDVLRGFASLAANARWATSVADITGLLRDSSDLTHTGQVYTGTAAQPKLAADPLLGSLYDPYAQYRVAFTLKVDTGYLPLQLDVKLSATNGPGVTLRMVYTGWGRKTDIKAPH